MSGRAQLSPDLLIRRTDHSRTLTLTAGRAGLDRLTLRLADEVSVRHIHGRFVENLARLRQAVGGELRCSPRQAAVALGALAEAGRVFLSSLFESIDDVHRLSEYVQQACPNWRSGPRSRVLHIQSVGRLDEHLPWELLPVFDLRHRPVASGIGDLEAASLPFGGFAAMVERRTLVSVPVPPTLDASRGLGVRFFYNAGFDGARAELGFLRAHADRIRLRGPYPRDGAESPPIGQLLRDPTLDDNGRPTDFADHVVHFACHCDLHLERAGPDQHAFCLESECGVEQRATVAQLLSELVCATSPGRPGPPKPIVFVNACNSATLDDRCGTGLLTPFDRNGNLALVGTVASVPDRLAAAFSERFYDKLLAGRSLGEAVFASRRNILLQHGNPLGILYCQFGSAELRLVRAEQPRRQSGRMDRR